MLRSLTKRGWRDHIASLGRQADAGEVSAMTDLGLTLLDGIQDRKGRSIVRRNPRSAVTWFRKAANRGDRTAASSLGYAYNVGLGTMRDVAQAIRWYRRAARSGDSTATSNLATVYRDAGKARLAFQWWKRAADMRDGDAAVDVGYCYQYGIGTRKNVANAKRMFRRAVASRDISQFGREEAMYHLAVQFIDEGKRQLAFPLLKRATADDDFPEAASVLNQLKTESDYVPCRCKRSINKQLRGHTKCSLHAR
jgi:TPR repeat protein